jgi:hypothetical protein
MTTRAPTATHCRMVAGVRVVDAAVTAVLFLSQHWAGIFRYGSASASEAAGHAALASGMLACGCMAMLIISALGAMRMGQVRPVLCQQTFLLATATAWTGRCVSTWVLRSPAAAWQPCCMLTPPRPHCSMLQAYMDTGQLVNRTTTLLVMSSKLCIVVLGQRSADQQLLSWPIVLATWLGLMGVAIVEERCPLFMGQAFLASALMGWVQPVTPVKVRLGCRCRFALLVYRPMLLVRCCGIACCALYGACPLHASRAHAVSQSLPPVLFLMAALLLMAAGSAISDLHGPPAHVRCLRQVLGGARLHAQH